MTVNERLTIPLVNLLRKRVHDLTCVLQHGKHFINNATVSAEF